MGKLHMLAAIVAVAVLALCANGEPASHMMQAPAHSGRQLHQDEPTPSDPFQDVPTPESFPSEDGSQELPTPESFPSEDGSQELPTPEISPSENGFQASPTEISPSENDFQESPTVPNPTVPVAAGTPTASPGTGTSSTSAGVQTKSSTLPNSESTSGSAGTQEAAPAPALSPPAKVATGVSLGVGLPTILSILGFCLQQRRRAKRGQKNHWIGRKPNQPGAHDASKPAGGGYTAPARPQSGRPPAGPATGRPAGLQPGRPAGPSPGRRPGPPSGGGRQPSRGAGGQFMAPAGGPQNGAGMQNIVDGAQGYGTVGAMKLDQYISATNEQPYDEHHEGQHDDEHEDQYDGDNSNDHVGLNM